ncbi:MAG TPA: biotin carboxylase N-terminal domain-containing protein [Planctomycetota bacterium]|nr:biotin carboxylase N-terminal domain-containing protein [Planctomycetota bacterium]
MFRRLLVANRGEIARRVLRAARALGVETVAVYSEADRGAPFTQEADVAVAIGPAEARKSYLDGAKILDVARRTGAEAIHPGYGFLSENAAFARACEAAGVVFVGPPASAIEAIGDKARARATALKVGVAPVPGHEGADDDASLLRASQAIGFPLLVKAAAGGGGKGMKRVDRAEDLADAIASARREALASFGDGALILERFVAGARHVEIQVLGDAQGRIVGLLERECTLQRRHQKIIEECPSPVLTPALRARMIDAAVRLAKAVGYRNAGTLEFLLADDGAFYFLEMNTRLQVEHPVTELVAGIDLVEWQLRIAAGEPLSIRQEDVAPRGAAIEARVYAEDPELGFLPQPGPVLLAAWPEAPGVRVDAGVETGRTVTADYDPMLAKIVAWGATRDEARRKLVAALRDTAVLGVRHNVPFLVELLERPEFADAAFDVHWIDRMMKTRARPSDAAPPEAWLLAAAAAADAGLAAGGASAGPARLPSPWDACDGFALVKGDPR